jgi:uncharacterized protein (DUF433 family)
MTLPDFLTRDKYGEIRVTGTRIDLVNIILSYRDGATAETMAENWDHISVETFRNVLAWYHENKLAVDAYVQDAEAEMARNRAARTQTTDIAALRKILEAKR